MFERAIRKNITETVCQILCGLKSFNEGGYYSDPYRAVLMVRAKIKKSSYEKLYYILILILSYINFINSRRFNW